MRRQHLPAPIDGQDRTVRKVQTNAIAWTVDDDSRPWPQQPLQWTYWPPARDVTVLDDDTFRMALRHDRGQVQLRIPP